MNIKRSRERDRIQKKAEQYKTMYQEEKYKPIASFSKILAIFGIILLMLFAARFLNHTLLWNMNRFEVEALPSFEVGDFHFHGLSHHQAVEEKLSRAALLSKKQITVASYFDGIHPNAFIISNRGRKTYVNLGAISVYPDTGITSIYLHSSDIIESRRKGSPTDTYYFGDSLFPGIYVKLADYISGNNATRKTKVDNGRGVSFFLNAVNDYRYLNYPYMIYFFLPLLAIFLLGAHYGRGFYVAFFYYLGIFLLFDYQRALFTAPFSGIMDFIGIDPSQTVSTLASLVIVSVFIILGFVGIFGGKKNKESDFTHWGKGLVFFFLLLPLVLRF